MTRKPDGTPKSVSRLRTEAEAHLTRAPTKGAAASPAAELLHELEVHQIELEMQNEELRRAQLALEESRDRYVDLYEFAPVGYLTLTAEGLISSMNLTGAALLGEDRKRILRRRFDRFVAREDRDRFHRLFVSLMSHDERETCELALRRGDGATIHAQLHCLRVPDGDKPPVARISLTDVTERKRWETLSRATVESAPTAMVMIDREGTVVLANAEVVRLFGFSREELLGRPVEQLVPERFRQAHPELRTSFLGNPQARPMGAGRELYALRKDGTEFPVEIGLNPIEADGGRFVLSAIVDITERKRAAAALEESEAQNSAIVQTALDCVVTIDHEGKILEFNSAAERVFGHHRADVLGKELAQVMIPPSQHEAHRRGLKRYLATGESSVLGKRIEMTALRSDGSEFPVELAITRMGAQEPPTFTGFIRDITQRKANLAEIESLAFYDPLTQLPNRRLLVDRLQKASVVCARTQRRGAILFIDLDDFKTLNDTQGHDVGDQLLQQVAQRLLSCVRAGDTVARLGGDEFVVMLEDLSGSLREATAQAETVGEKILAALAPPFLLAGHEHHSTGSVGGMLFGDHRETVDDLLKRADLAMYRAKAAGRNAMRFFHPRMQVAVTARAVLESELRRAVKESQFVLYYQPQVDGEGRVTGAEALARWQHPRRGLVAPADFIPLAEETGLIEPLGRWVLVSACAQLLAWSRRPATADLTLSMNVSAREFLHPEFVARTLAVIDRAGVDPRKLILEFTESPLPDNLEETIAKMTAIKAHGERFSLDDFGTGYSSLSYLKHLPLDQLKIDQSFVRDVLIEPSDAAIARTIMALGQSLGLAVIAEGVESLEQRDFLAHQGCRAFQGFLFGRPAPVDVMI